MCLFWKGFVRPWKQVARSFDLKNGIAAELCVRQTLFSELGCVFMWSLLSIHFWE